MRAVLGLLLLLQGPMQDSPHDDFLRADRKVVAYALTSPERAWNFITAEGSPYAERLAVAKRAGELLSWDYLAKIVEQYEKLKDGWSIPWDMQTGEQRLRSFDERRAAPWQFHVRFAIDEAWHSIVRARSRDDSFFAFAQSLPCSSVLETKLFAKATTSFAEVRHAPVPVEWIAAWRNILRRTGPGGSHHLEPFFTPLARYLSTNEETWQYAQILLLDRIEAGEIYSAAHRLSAFGDRLHPDDHRLPAPVPYTTILAAARRAAEDDSIRIYERVTAADAVTRAFAEPYLPADTKLDRHLEEHQPERLRLFKIWFAKRQNELVERAAAEKAGLDAARARLDAVTRCRGGASIASSPVVVP